VGIEGDIFSKITSAKRAGDMAPVLECLLSKHKALNSVPITTKKLYICMYVYIRITISKNWQYLSENAYQDFLIISMKTLTANILY
jgi:hypothetical protein